ncbi:MAG: hypothetical protein ABI054_06070 [Planctomycetota bacterium]
MNKSKIAPEMKLRIIRGEAAGADGPLVLRPKKGNFLRYDGIRVELNRGETRLMLLWRGKDVAYWDAPRMDNGETLTLDSNGQPEGEGFSGRLAFRLTDA